MILKNFDFQAAKEGATEEAVEVPSGIFLLEEREATEMLKMQQITPMKNASVLILVPETSKQPSWEVCNLQPEEYEVVIEKKDTKQIETIKAWILNLTGTSYSVIPEDVNIIVDAAPLCRYVHRTQKTVCRQICIYKSHGGPEVSDQGPHLKGIMFFLIR